MGKNKLDLLKRRFVLFESRINELESLRRILSSLDIRGFEEEISLIREKIFNLQDTWEISRSIGKLKLQIRRKQIESKSELINLIKQIFLCNSNINAWSYTQLRSQYISILKRYYKLPEEDKILIYGILSELRIRIKGKNEL
ncbi:hypothetical protein KY358_06870 [Candidatus Woesearchaeota archaeon]|nr:hypothetical protein [Candidatus Woesearchaeota archaeon]